MVFRDYRGVDCPYCGKPAQLVPGVAIYPGQKKLKKNSFWLCKKCDAYVGCYGGHRHPRPFGTLANAELRKWRQSVHAVFDPLWEDKSDFKTRGEAYKWLSSKLEIRLKFTHVGMFDTERCQNAIRACNKRKELTELLRKVVSRVATKAEEAFAEDVKQERLRDAQDMIEEGRKTRGDYNEEDV